MTVGDSSDPQAALRHFAHVGEGNARALAQRAAEYDKLTPFERMALGLTLYQAQLGLQRAMGGEALTRARTAPFSIKQLRDAALLRSEDNDDG